MVYRRALDYLVEWKDRKSRKPLVIRGARQVGKTWLARELATTCFDDLVEINFEYEIEAASLFESRNPKEILQLLEIQYGRKIVPGKTLLFLDEIQSAIDVFSTLRYFYELLPELHVIATGSLLEFHFGEDEINVPVGRVEYMFLGPMVFEEFLHALGKTELIQYLESYTVDKIIPEAIHLQLLKLLAQYILVGGMPESIFLLVETGSYRECDILKQSILSSYIDDFAKYGRRMNVDLIRDIFTKLPYLVGLKFKYSAISRTSKAREIRKMIMNLFKAGIATPIFSSSCNGIPIKAEKSVNIFKILFIDVGLLCRACGMNSIDMLSADKLMMINSGAVAEQFAGQHLLSEREFYEKPELYYWVREKKNSSAEVDYVTTLRGNIVPMEIKAGKTGSLKSLHMFLKTKDRSFGVRFNMDIPSLAENVTGLSGENVEYKLLSLPLYLIGQYKRLVDECWE
ncbi:MAG: ATP-binding protein [Candidatus Aegiribacteria sp.]|nr:ATP-binding protein [Candidatus Aegiribacteria sp.]